MTLGLIPDETLREIESRADIVGLIGRYVELKPAGRNHKGRCPFHEEKTPSFNVSPDRGTFYCFGCQAGGGIFKFLMLHENLTFPEAVRQIAGEVGVEIPETRSNPEQSSRTEKIFSALKVAQDSYRSALDGPLGAPGRDYLEARGLDRETIDAFGLGYVPDAWDTVESALRRAGVSPSVGVEAGLLLEGKKGGHYDRLRHRVIFPIQDVRGRFIAFGGRTLSKDDPAKYMNTPESPVFHKRRTFYGLPAALEHIRRAKRAIVCEGYFDAIALSRAGLGEALATCGTALTEDHAKELSRRTESVSLLFDGDAAGQNAMEKALAVLLPQGLRVRGVLLPEGQDPDDYLSAHGADALRALVDAAPAALDLVIRRAMGEGCETPDQKADVVRRVTPLVALIVNPVERAEWARRVGIAANVDPSAVEATVRSVRSGRSHEESDVLRETVVRPRRVDNDERLLQRLVGLVARYPLEVGVELYDRMRGVLPATPQRELILELQLAADAGQLDATGAIDVNRLEGRMPADLEVRLRAALMDELPEESEEGRRKEIDDLVARFEKKKIDAQASEARRRSHEQGSPDLDELNEILKKRRERLPASARVSTQS